MSALVKNGDLVPNAYGMIHKQQTRDALLRVGISEKVARETTNANFDHLSGLKELNVFRMNTVSTMSDREPDPPGPLEHFRSTGIREGSPTRGRPDWELSRRGSWPSVSRFNFMERECNKT